jgi:hypothetical protein
MKNLCGLKIFLSLFGYLSLSLAFLYSCAGTNPNLRISNFKYNYDDESYRIRSINCEQEGESYNELIGANFLAVDYNQDRIIDRIVMGNAELGDAQKIYEHGLDLLSNENRLSENFTEVAQYLETEECCSYEIKTFRIKDSNTFNEYIFIENRNSDNSVISAAIDQDADGNLDLAIKGSLSLESLQSKYELMIQRGLETNKMIKMNGKVLVKKS